MYTAGWNTPGYLPDTDSELPTFETATEAWTYLLDEYLFMAQWYNPDPDTLADFETAVRSGLTGNVAADGLVYWVYEAEEDKLVSAEDGEDVTVTPGRCSHCGAALVAEDCPNYGFGAEHAKRVV